MESGGEGGFKGEEEKETCWNEENRCQKLKKRGERQKGNGAVATRGFGRATFDCLYSDQLEVDS